MANSYEIVEFSSLDPIEQNLANMSINARNNAYCPYSHLQVGAALLCQDNTIFTGCNVENASYGMSICAEKTAIVKAVSEGHRKFKLIAVSSLLPDSNKFVSPCGSCRQVISEFSSTPDCDIQVLVVKADRRQVVRTKISQILPLGFSF
uniref:Cytidine deaminase n=1 Tax=Cacopsylla melanoneura TaxID=428564 RepID=A0A8D8QT02_9HEMI